MGKKHIKLKFKQKKSDFSRQDGTPIYQTELTHVSFYEDNSFIKHLRITPELINKIQQLNIEV